MPGAKTVCGTHQNALDAWEVGSPGTVTQKKHPTHPASVCRLSLLSHLDYQPLI